VTIIGADPKLIVEVNVGDVAVPVNTGLSRGAYVFAKFPPRYKALLADNMKTLLDVSLEYST
jgi:hypothetical protein